MEQDEITDPLALYCLEGCNTVQGWLQPGSMSVLWSILEIQRFRQLGGDVAEIGVFHGKLFIALALSLGDQERAIAVDIFEMPNVPDFEIHFQDNLTRFGVSLDRIEIHRQPSGDIDLAEAHGVFGTNVRLFSVDGSHDYEPARHDLALAKACISEKGVIALDDLFSAWSPGVTEAAIDFLRDPENQDMAPLAIAAGHGPLSTGAGRLFLAYRSQIEPYAKELIRMNGACFKTMATFCGSPTLVFDFSGEVKKTVQFR